MIFNYILTFLLNIVDIITSLFSEIPDVDIDVSGLNTIVSVIMFMLGKPLVVVAVTTLTFWLVFQPTMSLIKFIYRKIPGIT